MPAGLLWTLELAAAFFAAGALVTTVYAGVIGAPFVATPKRAIRKALEAVRLRPGEKMYDLGCGNGGVVIAAARDFGARAVGLELSLYHYVLAKANILMRGQRGRAQVFWGNLYTRDISDADVVFCWLTPRTFPKLESKFERELKPGTRIVTFSTPLPFYQAETTVQVSPHSYVYTFIKK